MLKKGVQGEMASSLPLLLFFLCFADAAQNFQEVSVCPRNADTWKIESDKKNCQGETPDYLCAAIENNVGRYGEICTKYGLSPDRKCAVLNNQTHNLDSVDCKAPTGCPLTPYNPSELWKYPVCYEDFYGITTAPPTTTTVQTTVPPVSGQKEEGGGSGAGAAVGVVVALLVVVVVVLVVLYRRNMCGVRKTMGQWVDNIRNHLQGNREGETRPSDRADLETGVSDDTEKPLLSGNEAPKNGSEKHKQEEMNIKKLNILQKYLVHILRREIDAKDLKEKTIIHSKSLGEHFTEPVLQDLYKIEKTDGYSQLDMSLVFVLLRNFCENINPPSRGWDYEPPEDEDTVGADIERIRSMWNNHCDNNFDFKNLDDVFNRMKNRYGTVAVHNDPELQKNKDQDEIEGFSKIKEKIKSIELNPDCYVKKGIVITGEVKSALQSLMTGNVVICKGAIGCGKTHTLKAIQNKYIEKKWKVRWMEENLLPLEENMEDETIVICDNLFGSFGCNTFSSSRISSFENLLESVRDKSGNIKIAVGIHQHVFDEIKRNHNLKLLQNKNITVDLDKLTKSELLLILKEQQKEGHCQADPNCWFKTVDLTLVIDKLKENQGHIGTPFLSLLYCHYHDLFSDEAFTKAPLQTLTQRFQKMRNGSVDFSSLVYLMCVKKHRHGDELTTWAGTIDAYLTKEAFQNVTKLSGFIRVENGVESLRHEVLTIALFKAAASVEEVLLPVVQHCEIGILLQLIRPAEKSNANPEFTFAFADPQKNDTQVRNIGKYLVKRFADAFKTDWFKMMHPLKDQDLFEKKFKRYLSNDPKEKK